MSDRPSIDPRGPRFGAVITATLLAADLVLALCGAALAALVLLAVVCAVFAWGAFAGVGRHPYGVLYRRLVRPRLAPPAELEDPRAPTFAQGVGFAVTLIGVVLGAVGVPAGVGAASALAFVAAFLNAAFDICIGCRLYVVLVRARLVRRSRTA